MESRRDGKEAGELFSVCWINGFLVLESLSWLVRDYSGHVHCAVGH